MNCVDNEQDRHGWRICIVGTGGQGVLTAARSLCDVFVEWGHHVVSGQLHGMAQRGGSVQSTVIIDSGISPVIGRGRASCVLGFEPVETARALPFMSSCTVVYMNTAPVVPYVLGQRFASKEEGAEYPSVGGLVEHIRAVTHRVCTFDATKVAVEAGSAKAMNTVMLGCLLGAGLLPCPAEQFWHIIAERMPARMVKTNSEAYRRGAEFSRDSQSCESNV